MTLNPVSHIDLFGSIILPFLLAISGQPVLGWAKPVPYNPYNLEDPRRGGALIAVAGPLSNVLIALIFGLIIRGADLGFIPLDPFLVGLFEIVVFLNLLLGFFNLLPIPPIDGSKVILVLLPHSWRVSWEAFWARLERIIMENLIVALIVLFLTLPYILEVVFFILNPLIGFFFDLFVGRLPGF